jgi:hypothetical protein
MHELIRQTTDKIEAWLSQVNKPAVLWSGGKDSTAMLHLLLFKVGAKLPVIQWREPRHRHRYAHSDFLAREWDLEMHDYTPYAYGIQDGYDIETGAPRFDFVKAYEMAPHKVLLLFLGTEPPTPFDIETNRYLCGLDCLQRPTGRFNFPWDAVFHGQKSADVDLIKGQVPLAQDVVRPDDAPWQFYPMREWTDADVWSYLESEGVPNDPTRYQKIHNTWQHNPDKSSNADYYPVCFNCVNRHAGPVVHCPKLRAATNNISHLAPYIDFSSATQGFQPTWNNTTVNGVAHVAATSGVGPCSAATAPTPPASLPTTSAPTTLCSKPRPADAASPSVAKWAEESPAQYTNTVRLPAEHLSPAAHSA